MSNSNEAKVERWRCYIDECRKEATLLGPEGRQAMQTVIDSYERLIAAARAKAKPTGKAASVDGLGRKVMDWFRQTTSIAGFQIPNGLTALGAAVIVILLIYSR